MYTVRKDPVFEICCRSVGFLSSGNGRRTGEVSKDVADMMLIDFISRFEVGHHQQSCEAEFCTSAVFSSHLIHYHANIDFSFTYRLLQCLTQ